MVYNFLNFKNFLGLNPQVHRYLELQLHKQLPSSELLERQKGVPRAPLRRKMSVKGAIKKTRSIAIERGFYLFI